MSEETHWYFDGAWSTEPTRGRGVSMGRAPSRGKSVGRAEEADSMVRPNPAATVPDTAPATPGDRTTPAGEVNDGGAESRDNARESGGARRADPGRRVPASPFLIDGDTASATPGDCTTPSASGGTHGPSAADVMTELKRELRRLTTTVDQHTKTLDRMAERKQLERRGAARAGDRTERDFNQKPSPLNQPSPGASDEGETKGPPARGVERRRV